MKDEIGAIMENISPRLVEIRRQIHRHPEPAFEEEKTSSLIEETLEELGLEVKTGIAGTGVLGILGREKKEKAPTVAIRADMDALPIHEKGDHNYRSQIDGYMHACGHDGHVAIALGTAMLAERLQDYLPGPIKFIFQPAEEGPGGAEKMISEGVLEDPEVDYILALHIWSDREAGEVGFKRGVGFASIDEFDITLQGMSAHGGSPHQGKDALAAAGELIMSLQNIVSRSVNPVKSAVITVGKIKGGDRRNIIPASIEMEGTVRALEEEMREFLESRIRDVIAGVVRAHGINYELTYRNMYPPLTNHRSVTDLVARQAEKILCQENVIDVKIPTMGGEDFAYFLREKPGTMFWLGGRNEDKGITAPNHHPRFDFDESIMPLGVKIMFNSARELMISGPDEEKFSET